MTQTLSDGVTHQPVGPMVDARPARRPQDVRLEGRFGAVEKLAVRHAVGLWDATQGHDQIRTYMSAYGPFDSWSSFSDWVATRTQLEDPFSYAVLDRNGAAIGVATLMEIRPAMRVIEMGHIVYAPNLQRTPLATGAQFLLACYVLGSSAIGDMNGSVTR
jgi:RimJ/RimL family protein N-acetyltransferase